jgi:single-strand DNA-binding protein
MNSITIAGQLGKDAEVRFLPNGDAVAGFSVADSQGKDKDTIWWSCQLFGKRAESLSQYLLKGQAVTVSGTVSPRKYTDQDGKERTSMDVRVNDVALQGGKREAAPQTAPARQEPRKAAQTTTDFDDDSSIPF